MISRKPRAVAAFIELPDDSLEVSSTASIFI